MLSDIPSDEIAFLKAIAQQLNMEFVDLEDVECEPIALKFINEKLARLHNLIPISADENEIVIAISDPSELKVLEDIKIISGRKTVPVLAPAQEIQAKIDEFYKNTETAEQAVEDFRNETSDLGPKEAIDTTAADVDNAPIVRIVNSILTDAIKDQASDIHIEPFEKFVLDNINAMLLQFHFFSVIVTAHPLRWAVFLYIENPTLGVGGSEALKAVELDKKTPFGVG